MVQERSKAEQQAQDSMDGEELAKFIAHRDLVNRLTELTQARVVEIAAEAGRAAAREVLEIVGIDVDNPIAAQADFAHLRRQRAIVERSTLGLLVAVGTLLAGGVGYAITHITH